MNGMSHKPDVISKSVSLHLGSRYKKNVAMKPGFIAAAIPGW